MRRALGLLLCLALAGCGPIEKQVRNGLMSAGITKSVATCMAGRMVDKLSVFQLKRMASLGNLRDERLKEMSYDRLMHNVRALKDPEIVTVTSVAWFKCTV